MLHCFLLFGVASTQTYHVISLENTKLGVFADFYMEGKDLIGSKIR
jgi:hypothetical protein